MNGRQTNLVAATIRWRINEAQPGTQVIFLQEVCSVDIERLSTLDGMEGWEFQFAAIRDQGNGSSPRPDVAPRQCHADIDSGAGRGQFGIAIGVQSRPRSPRTTTRTSTCRWLGTAGVTGTYARLRCAAMSRRSSSRSAVRT